MSASGTSSTTPLNYSIIRAAGEGKSGQVNLAVDSATIDSARGEFATGNEKDAIMLAVSKVVAIKSANTGVSLASERRILGNIRAKAHLHNGGNKIVRLLNADSGPDPRWLVLSTMAVCCDLHSVIMHATDIDINLPPVLVWSVSEQLYRALYFLQEVCNPPIQHGDLNTTNVLIGYHNLPARGLPICMVIDFGESTEGIKDNAEHFLNVMGNLAQEAADNEQISKFLAAWGDEELGQKGIEEAWTRFGDETKAAIAAVTVKEEQEVATLVCEAAKAASGQSGTSGGIEEDVQKLLE